MPAKGTKAASVMVAWSQPSMLRLWMPAKGTEAAPVIVYWSQQLMFQALDARQGHKGSVRDGALVATAHVQALNARQMRKRSVRDGGLAAAAHFKALDARQWCKGCVCGSAAVAHVEPPQIAKSPAVHAAGRLCLAQPPGCHRRLCGRRTPAHHPELLPRARCWTCSAPRLCCPCAQRRCGAVTTHSIRTPPAARAAANLKRPLAGLLPRGTLLHPLPLRPSWCLSLEVLSAPRRFAVLATWRRQHHDDLLSWRPGDSSSRGRRQQQQSRTHERRRL